MKVKLQTFAKKKMSNNGKNCHDSITWKYEFEYHKQIVEYLEELKTRIESEKTK